MFATFCISLVQFYAQSQSSNWEGKGSDQKELSIQNANLPQDRFFENQELLVETLSLFDMKDCTLFEALHLVFGHALSLPGEAQKV